jgi:dolichol-phosphate mannosyltransferase
MLQKEFEDCFRKQNEKKTGLGTAYVHGFKVGIRNKYDFIFEMDADFSHLN